MATESRESVSQVLSDSLYATKLFHYDKIENEEVKNLSI